MNRLARFTISVLLGLSVAAGFTEAKQKPKPCQPNLASCPIYGCATPGTAAALLNERKRTVPTGDAPTVLTLDDFESLQEQADERLGGNQKNLAAAKRKKLKNLQVPSGATVGEGSLVEVRAFIVGLEKRPSANTSGESVNCRLKGTVNNDFHIPIARHWGDSEFEGIVVEMIPQNRHAKWSVGRLKEVARQQRQVRVRGGLFYDNEHFVNDDVDNPISGQPAPFSLWEVHPVTELLVCKTPKKKCDPSDQGLWEPLEAASDLDE